MLIRYTGIDGCNGFLAIEVNYSEAMSEFLPDMRTRFDELSLISDAFLKPAASACTTTLCSSFGLNTY